MTGVSTTDEASTKRCPYCERRERTSELLALHVGEDHWERATTEERERYREAYERESEELWRFRLLVLGALVSLYFGFLFAYAIVG